MNIFKKKEAEKPAETPKESKPKKEKAVEKIDNVLKDGYKIYVAELDGDVEENCFVLD